MELSAKNTYEEVTAWKRTFTLVHDEQEYRVTLYWDMHDGYDYYFNQQGFKPATTPDWAINWEDTHDEPFAFYLDDLTCNMEVSA